MLLNISIMPLLPYKGIHIRYSDSGKGKAVVLLHGFLENMTMWDDFESALQKKNRIIKIDLLGHGETECLGYIHTMEDMAEAVRFVLQHLRLKKYFVVGHSMGGYVSLALAEMNPDSIRGLMLFYSTAAADSEEKQEQRNRAVDLVKENHKSFVRVSLPMLFRPKSRRMYSEEIKAIKKEGVKLPKQGIIAALEGMKVRSDKEGILHFSPFDIAFVSGVHDPVLNIEELKEQHEAPKVRSVCITENGHMGHIEDRDQTLKAIQDFIQ